MLSEEVEYENIKIGNQKDEFAIRITDGTFAWGKEKPKEDKDKKENKNEQK